MRRIAILFVVTLMAALIQVAASTAASGSGSGEPRPADPDQLKAAIAAKQRHAKRLLTQHGVVAIGAGLRADGQSLIKIYTEFAGVAGLPATLDGIPVEVEVTGRIMAQADPTARFPRPVPTSVSVGHPDITAGTFGARVTDGTDVYVLSNNHVIANINSAQLGDPILQPGTLDGGQLPGDAIATLSDFEPINFAQGATNTIDAAIAKGTPSDLGYATPSDGYGVPSATTAPASVGMSVKKYGRTTGLTTGTIDALNVTVDVCYVAILWFCLEEARFVNQIAVTGENGDFSGGGDSGSTVVTASGNEPVGLLFAGGSGVTFANRIDLVLTRFGVSIDDGSASGGGDPGNEPPIADDDGYSTAEDTTLTVSAPGVLANDDPVDGDELTASLLSGPANAASFTLNADGSFSYEPVADFSGEDSFSYWAADGNGGSDTAIVTLTVSPVNDAPHADAGSDQIVTVGDLIQLDGSGSGDPDGDPYSYAWSLSTPSGSGTTFDDPSAESPTFAADVEGAYVAALIVSDGTAADTDSVTVSVLPPNEPPNAAPDFHNTDEETPLSVAAPGVLENDSDTDGDPLTAIYNSGPSHAAAFSLNPDGSFDYTPESNFSGTDFFTYYADDGRDRDLATVAITVQELNDEPLALDESYSASAGVTLSVAAPGVLENDSDLDGDPLSATLLSASTGAESFTFNADGSFEYVSAVDFAGDDAFTYEVSDGRGGTAMATATISVTGAPPPPPARSTAVLLLGCRQWLARRSLDCRRGHSLLRRLRVPALL